MKKMNNKMKGFYDDDWWLDYLENEVDSLMKKKMDVSLGVSLIDRRTFKGLEKFRKLIKNSDEVVLPEDLSVYDKLHEKIMDAVEDVDGEIADKNSETRLLFVAKSRQRATLREDS